MVDWKTCSYRQSWTYIEPTVFADVAEDARIAQEEIFGPVTAFIKAKDADDALRIAITHNMD